MCIVTQSRTTLCALMDCSPQDSSVRGILQAIILEWVAMPSSGGSSQPRDQIHMSVSPALAGGFFTTLPPGNKVVLLLLLLLSCFSGVQLCATPWTVACQAPLSMGFSRQEYWSGLLCLVYSNRFFYLCFGLILHILFNLLASGHVSPPMSCLFLAILFLTP